MKNNIQLSSIWSFVALHLSTLLILIISPIFYLLLKISGFPIGGIIITTSCFSFMIGCIIYGYINICDAQIIDNKTLLLKKIFRSSKTYTFDKIGYPSSLQIGRSKYISIDMNTENKDFEKYLIVNSKSILTSVLGFENNNTEEILIKLRKEARKK